MAGLGVSFFGAGSRSKETAFAKARVRASMAAARQQAEIEAVRQSAIKAAKFKNVGRMSLIDLADRIGGPRGDAAKIATLAFAMEFLSNYGKANGPWRDQTGNLRNSYAWEIAQTSRGVVTGRWGNTANYAADVEFRPRYWVLSGAMKANRKWLSKTLGLRIDKDIRT